MLKHIKSQLVNLPGLRLIRGIWKELFHIRQLLSDLTISKLLASKSKYQSPLNLARFEHRVFSQNGEDGIIREIFRRIGTTNRFFVEFGVESGIECNSLLLLHDKWQGCWLDGNPRYVEAISQTFADFLKTGKLKVRNAFITAENVQQLFTQLNVPAEPDLLSIDLDGNDYWIWKAVTDYKPRVVVIEYNSAFPSDMDWVMTYNPDHRWDSTSYQGASLKSLEILASEKGYNLVGCTLTGSNAFFVRKDAVGDNFQSPFTSEMHYEAYNFSLIYQSGHPRAFGPFVNSQTGEEKPLKPA